VLCMYSELPYCQDYRACAFFNTKSQKEHQNSLISGKAPESRAERALIKYSTGLQEYPAFYSYVLMHMCFLYTPRNTIHTAFSSKQVSTGKGGWIFLLVSASCFKSTGKRWR